MSELHTQHIRGPIAQRSRSLNLLPRDAVQQKSNHMMLHLGMGIVPDQRRHDHVARLGVIQDFWEGEYSAIEYVCA